MQAELESSILKPSKERVASYGKRPDGSATGMGFFGEIPHPTEEGVFSTELTIGVHLDGKPYNIPLLVPTLTRDELHAVMIGKEDERIIRKAVDHAKRRINQGRSPYAEPNEIYPLPKE
jgi:hypothetical protein